MTDLNERRGKIVFAAIVPHGEIIPTLASESIVERTRDLVRAMEQIGEACRTAQPNTVIIMSPHGFRIEDAICVALTERASGSLTENDATISADMAVDQHLARLIANSAKTAGISVACAVYGSSSGPASSIPLDWGALVPLWYLGARWESRPQIVVVVPSRSVPYPSLIDFGRAIARASSESGRRVAVIASADWAHAHTIDGPYGYHPAAAKLDKLVQEIVKSGNLFHFQDIPSDLIENGLPDGVWQCLILAGALENGSLESQFLSYQCPSYYGMLCALWRDR